MQAQICVGNVDRRGVEIDDSVHHLSVHIADSVTTSFGYSVQISRGGRVVGAAQLRLGVPGIQHAPVLMDGGQAPSPGSAVGRGGLRSRRLRHGTESNQQRRQDGEEKRN